MNINDILQEKDMTRYKLAKESGVPQTTVSDICSGKSKIEKCSAGTLYKLAKVLNVSMETLLEESMEYRSSFEIFKSNICHLVHHMGDMDFLIDTLESNKIRELYEKKWYPEALYLLAMVDYISRENDIPLYNQYNDIRQARLEKRLYPSGILLMAKALKDEKIMTESWNQAIPEFKRFNIVESEVRNVYSDCFYQ